MVIRVKMSVSGIKKRGPEGPLNTESDTCVSVQARCSPSATSSLNSFSLSSRAVITAPMPARTNSLVSSAFSPRWVLPAAMKKHLQHATHRAETTANKAYTIIGIQPLTNTFWLVIVALDERFPGLVVQSFHFGRVVRVRVYSSRRWVDPTTILARRSENVRRQTKIF